MYLPAISKNVNYFSNVTVVKFAYAPRVQPLCTCPDCKGIQSHPTQDTPSKRVALKSHPSDAIVSSPFYNVKYNISQEAKQWQVPTDIQLLILEPFQMNAESFLVGLVCKHWSSLIKRNRNLTLSDIMTHYAYYGNFEPIKLFKEYSAK
jgi:SET domain-containing protein